jgi:histidinol-phosphate aminotransferase
MKNLVRKNILNLKPYIPGKPIEEVEREIGIKNIIKLASNENCLGPSPKAIKAIKSFSKKINLYPDGNCYLLKKVLAKKLKVKNENLVIGCGSDEIIHLIVLAFLNKGDEVITCTPSFIIYETNTILMDGKLKLVKLKDFKFDLKGFDLKGIKNSITDKTKLIFIANPNNPTGTIVKKEEVKEFLKDIPRDVIVIFDEAYYEYVEDKDFPNILSFIKRNMNVILLRTFSKIYGLAGLRIGYGIGKKEIIENLNRVREPFNVNSVAQFAALAALSDNEHIKESKRLNSQGKKFLYNEFKKLNLFFVPTQANFIFLNVGIDSRILFEKMLKKGIIIRTGDIFGLPNFIRVTIGKMEENERFIKVLKEILNLK